MRDRSLDSYPAVSNAVNTILSKEDFKEMEPELAQKLVMHFGRSWGPNTELYESARGMVQDSYHIKDVTQPAEWVAKQWRDSWLVYAFGESFAEIATPPLALPEELDRVFVDWQPGIRRPMPNLLFGLEQYYGLTRKGYDISWMLRSLPFMNTSCGIWFPFLLIEYTEHAVAWAMYQALRPGSALLAANEKMRACAGLELSKLSVTDKTNMVFSVAMNQDAATAEYLERPSTICRQESDICWTIQNAFKYFGEIRSAFLTGVSRIEWMDQAAYGRLWRSFEK
ncbi:MAG: hypothetical protein Q9210_004102 [Variospora velana]